MRCPRSWGFSRGSPRRQHVARDPTCRQNMEKGGGSCYRSERQVLGPDLTGRVSRGKASGLEAWSEDLQDDSMRLKILPAGRTWKRMAGAAPRSDEVPEVLEDSPEDLQDGSMRLEIPPAGREHGGGRRELLPIRAAGPRARSDGKGLPRQGLRS